MSPVSPNQKHRQAGEDLPLVGDRRGVHDVVGGDAVGGDHEQVVVELVDLADLALGDERESARVTPPGSTSQLVREVGQVLRAVLGDHDEVLEAAAAEPGPVAAGLHRDDVAGAASSPRRPRFGRSCTSSPTPWPSEWK